MKVKHRGHFMSCGERNRPQRLPKKGKGGDGEGAENRADSQRGAGAQCEIHFSVSLSLDSDSAWRQQRKSRIGIVVKDVVANSRKESLGSGVPEGNRV